MTERVKGGVRYPEQCRAGHKLDHSVVYVPSEGKGGARWRCRVCLRAGYRANYKLMRDKRLAEGWVPHAKRNQPPLATECKEGHPWSEANTYNSPSIKHRQCRECRRIRLRRKRKEKASSAAKEAIAGPLNT